MVDKAFAVITSFSSRRMVTGCYCLGVAAGAECQMVTIWMMTVFWIRMILPVWAKLSVREHPVAHVKNWNLFLCLTLNCSLVAVFGKKLLCVSWSGFVILTWDTGVFSIHWILSSWRAVAVCRPVLYVCVCWVIVSTGGCCHFWVVDVVVFAPCVLAVTSYLTLCCDGWWLCVDEGRIPELEYGVVRRTGQTSVWRNGRLMSLVSVVAAFYSYISETVVKNSLLLFVVTVDCAKCCALLLSYNFEWNSWQ